MLNIQKETGWYARFRVKGKVVPFLLDSGASCSFMDTEVWKSVNLGRPHILEPVDARYVLADGSPLRVEGKAQVQLEWGQGSFLQDIVVAPLSGHGGILGLDFIERNRVSLHLADGFMMIGHVKVTLRKEGSSPSCAKIQAKTALTVPARSSVWVGVEMDHDLVATKVIRQDGMCAVESLDGLTEDTGLFMANQVITASGQSMKVNILNVHDEPILIEQGVPK